MKDKELLIDNLSNITPTIKKKSVINDIKIELSKYKISAGNVQSWLDDPHNLENSDVREIYLFTQQVYLKSGSKELMVEKYFTQVEASESKIYDASIKKREFDFPITFEHATVVGTSAYAVPISVQMIDMMLNNQLLQYDPELQREMQVVTDRKGSIRYEPTLIKKNVEEITEHLLNGTLVPTTLVFNVAMGSSSEGEELVFNPKNATLTITKSSKCSVVDGFHRCNAASKALRINPDLEFNFVLIITNYTKSQAQRYQAQLAEATPISKTRKEQLKAERHADKIIPRLMQESDLKDRISQKTQLKTTANQLVSYDVLANAIENYIEIKTSRDTRLIGDFLVEFFNELIGVFSDEFIDNVSETRDKSLINQNNMFIGYIILADKLFRNGIDVSKLEGIIKSIDFSKDNELWKRIGVLDEKGRIEDTTKARKAIAKYFSELKLEEMVV